MTIPYTYFLKNKITGEKYYGVRYANSCTPNDLWTTYFTSSKYVKNLIVLYGVDSFDFSVRKIFTTAKDARNWEERVLRKLNILNNNTWLNKNVCGKFLKEGPQSKDHIEKRASKIRGSKRGPCSEEIKLKISKSSKGISKPMTEEHIKNLKCHINNSIKVSCPYCDKIGQLTNMKRWHFDKCKLYP